LIEYPRCLVFVFSYAPEKIPGLIESSDADLRNQAGETIAVLYEIAREINSVWKENCDIKNMNSSFI
jgi:hypothetical protein